MLTKRLTPILNVSDMSESFAWFESFGWKKGWDWGTPPTFGGVCSGDSEIFLCLDGQGGKAKRPLRAIRGFDDDDAVPEGVWMSLWVDDVDAIHQHCVAQGIEITMPPADEPWGVREMHVRHPDGHIFRVSQSLEEEDEPL
jgi:catechol 2,3-dioxygenase-like lactoylglutathione lyase family enzyme